LHDLGRWWPTRVADLAGYWQAAVTPQGTGGHSATVLRTLAAGTAPGGARLLCPMEDPALLPKLDGAVVRVGDNEWIPLPDAWVANAHRSTVRAS
jgi:hypothetical protein